MRAIVIIILLGLLAGCISSRGVMYDEKIAYLPSDPNSVKVFRNKPPREYISLGEVTAGRSSRIHRVENALRNKAAEMGGDAVIITNTTGQRAGNADVVVTKITLSGIVIKFKDAATLGEK